MNIIYICHVQSVQHVQNPSMYLLVDGESPLVYVRNTAGARYKLVRDLVTINATDSQPEQVMTGSQLVRSLVSHCCFFFRKNHGLKCVL